MNGVLENDRAAEPGAATGAAGLVFNIQRFSINDGPGIRTTVFLSGCALRCVWCHNPESQSVRPVVIVVETRCIDCGECRRACRHGAPTPARDPERASLCTLCFACVDACPTGARQVVGRWMTVEQVMREIRKDRLFYDDSGGGVTFSGGEPLYQAPFVLSLLEACRREGLRTALDTCGFVAPAALLEAARLADLVLYDIKVLDAECHRRLTGVSNRRILDNLVALSDHGATIWLRVPVIPGFNDDEANVCGTAMLASRTPAVRRVNLLPYHPTAAHKSRRLGRSDGAAGIATPGRERLEALAAVFRREGLDVRIGG